MSWWRNVAHRAVQTARLMVGVPDYDAYVAHCTTHHPDAPVLTRADFHRNRIERRYGTGKDAPPRCC
ncbi:YbdD/YjiX family protein [Sphingomonas phyllosphaerae]|uniref:YbdD/YjiX family protein n=1 Tax=Sphingomonas phyllosphaerae TaxID=257003 RepID=UPI0006849DAA|nr:CstA-like transporter-associated (seleno)protein [Sphingomonas phyllosphaerae]